MVTFYKDSFEFSDSWIRECSSGKEFTYMWPESVASRGSHKIGSCILKYLQLRATEANHLIAFSDAYGGQNQILWLQMYAVSISNFTCILL